MTDLDFRDSKFTNSLVSEFSINSKIGQEGRSRICSPNYQHKRIRLSDFRKISTKNVYNEDINLGRGKFG